MKLTASEYIHLCVLPILRRRLKKAEREWHTTVLQVVLVDIVTVTLESLRRHYQIKVT